MLLDLDHTWSSKDLWTANTKKGPEGELEE